MIKVVDIVKKYYNGKTALPVLLNLNLEILEGQTVCILGPSGCGKSTLLRCLSGLIDFDGEVIINGKQPKELIRKKGIGFMFQDSGLIPWKTALENVFLPSQIGQAKLKTNVSKENAYSLLKMVGLGEYAAFYPNQLSGGMRQRVAIARTLLTDPKVILLDEPFSAIDALTRLQLITDLSDILRGQNATTVMVTHNLEEAVLLGDRVVIMSKRPGKIISDFTYEFYEPRSINLFNNIEFINVVNKCRKILFNNEN